MISTLIPALLGLAIGGLLVGLPAAARLRELRARLAQTERHVTELEMQLQRARDKYSSSVVEIAKLQERMDAEHRAAQEKLALLEEARTKFADAFKALSADALKSSSESFLQLAQERLVALQQGAKAELEARQKAIEQLAQPIRERLEKFDGKLDELEKSRVGAYRVLTQQVDDLLKIHLPQLHNETASLVKALRQPTVRGRWGEIQLKRVVEMAGMLEHCDFVEQASFDTEDGRLRPDLIVRLPGGKWIVVDAKAPLEAYLQAAEATDDAARNRALTDHARQVREHMTALGRKSYWDKLKNLSKLDKLDATPEFVVLFLPGEMFFSAALQQDPGLIEFGVGERVIPATPTTLIALLRAVAYGWRQEALAENAAEVAALGKQLYERIAKLAEHWVSVGNRLDQAVDAYNKSVGSLESMVLPAARRFRDLKAIVSDRDIDSVAPLTKETRALTAEELTRPRSEAERSGL